MVRQSVGNVLQGRVTMTICDTIAPAYVRLALAIEPHIPNYIDAYFGPPEWRAPVPPAGPRPVDELVHEAAGLSAALAGDTAREDPLRHDYLSAELRALQTVLRILRGESIAFAEEVAGIFDIYPEWADEQTFAEAHRALEEFLPPGPTIQERMAARNTATEISVARAEPLLHVIIAELRRRTQARFPLPDGESFELRIVVNQPWSAYNWYLGDFHSRIDVNTDLPLHVTGLVNLLAHEGYPGHHTEHSLKEARLARERGYPEFRVTPLYGPSSALSEGIAMRAASVVLADEEWVAWHADELFPRAGLGHLDAAREHAIIKASDALEAVFGNAAMLLHERGASPDEVIAYLRRYGLMRDEEARQSLRFLTPRLDAAYAFNYYYGAGLLDALFAARGEAEPWFARLLTEPVTLGQVRTWIAGGM
jgi:hypothetical protein